MQQSSYPLARTENLVMREVGETLLVFDVSTSECASLEGDATTIWNLCDGTRSVEQLVQDAALDGPHARAAVDITLEQLRAVGLLVEGSIGGDGLRGLSRRAMMKRLGVAGAAIPVVTSLLVPSAAAAQSGCLGVDAPCSADGNDVCCPGLTCLNTESGPTGRQCTSPLP
jgi:hypothetical protein